MGAFLLLVLAAAGTPARASPARAAASTAPPRVLVDRGACPFEGCAYGTWTAREDAALRSRPGGRATGVVVKKGERVRAITGEVHVKPLRVVVRREIEVSGSLRLRAGDTYYLLTSLGEGFYTVWVRGAFASLDPDFTWAGKGSCSESPGGCASEPEGGREAFVRWTREGAVWWVKLRTASGAFGWSSEPGKFDGKDLLE
ncbi:MAG TPA: hypothetical protein VFL83_13010 [Anaeromyxobacter sp.]|nr:hypothetical protein [Anaeromyxobacter sp.]